MAGFAAATVVAGTATTAAPAALARASVSSGTFSSVRYINPAPDPGVLTAVGIGKITGSGRNDLVADAVNCGNVGGFTRVYVYPQQANGTLGKPITYQNTDIDSGDNRCAVRGSAGATAVAQVTA